MKENGQHIFETFWQGREEVCIFHSGQVEREAERFGGVRKKVSKHDARSASIE